MKPAAAQSWGRHWAARRLKRRQQGSTVAAAPFRNAFAADRCIMCTTSALMVRPRRCHRHACCLDRQDLICSFTLSMFSRLSSRVLTLQSIEGAGQFLTLASHDDRQLTCTLPTCRSAATASAAKHARRDQQHATTARPAPLGGAAGAAVHTACGVVHTQGRHSRQLAVPLATDVLQR